MSSDLDDHLSIYSAPGGVKALVTFASHGIGWATSVAAIRTAMAAFCDSTGSSQSKDGDPADEHASVDRHQPVHRRLVFEKLSLATMLHSMHTLFWHPPVLMEEDPHMGPWLQELVWLMEAACHQPLPRARPFLLHHHPHLAIDYPKPPSHEV